VTDGQTDGIAMAYTRYSIYAVVRKKSMRLTKLEVANVTTNSMEN